jgi:acyl-[acyl-carrier-protein] desaturase
MAYVALQELATRIAHFNTGELLDDGHGQKVMKRVAADENLHYLFYRDLAQVAIQLDPSRAMHAIERQVVDFEMPGTGIPGFAAHAAAISQAGIYDLTIHHDQILAPVVLRHWGLESLTGLDDDAEASRDRLLARLAKSERVARRLADRRAVAAGV